MYNFSITSSVHCFLVLCELFVKISVFLIANLKGSQVAYYTIFILKYFYSLSIPPVYSPLITFLKEGIYLYIIKKYH
jgi:hypothetical protein